MKKHVLVVMIALLVLSGACARIEQPTPAASTSLDLSSQTVLSKEEQEKKAFKLFEEILSVVQESTGEENFRKVEQLYLELIKTCPDIGLAQEGSWRLFSKYYEQGSPESLAKAKDLYAYFIKRYPTSVFREPMAKKMGVSTSSGKAK